MPSYYIDTIEVLEDFCNKIKNSPYIALDTEFIREKTYYPRLALLQIADSEHCACIDPLSIENLDPLIPLLQDQKITKIFHAGKQDMEILFQRFGQLPASVFDTQIAAAILGHGGQVSYAQLVENILSLKLDKTQTRTDWMKRPLSQKQIEYAENDVKYLVKIYPEILKSLEESGKQNWLDDEFLSLVDPDNYIVRPEQYLKRIKGINKLNKSRLVILRELAEWREKTAMQEDRPRQHVIQDDALITIARIKPDKSSKLYGIRGLNESKVRKYEAEIMTCIEKASKIPQSDWPTLPRPLIQNANQEAMTDSLIAILKICSDHHNIASSILANRKDIEKLVSGNHDIPLMNGWRKKQVGNTVLDFLNGKSLLRVQNDKLEITSS
jgi:ribonuclease D